VITKHAESAKKALQRAAEIAKKASIERKLQEINETLRRIDTNTLENAGNESESVEPATETSSAEPDSTPTPMLVRQPIRQAARTPHPPAHAQYKYPFEYENPIRRSSIIDSVEPASRQESTESGENTESVTVVEDASQQAQSISPRYQAQSMTPSDQSQSMPPLEQPPPSKGQSSTVPISISSTPDPISTIAPVRRSRRSNAGIPPSRYHDPDAPRTRAELRANDAAIRKGEKAARKAREATTDIGKAAMASERIMIDGKPLHASEIEIPTSYKQA
jgi:hypothetical protein